MLVPLATTSYRVRRESAVASVVATMKLLFGREATSSSSSCAGAGVEDVHEDDNFSALAWDYLIIFLLPLFLPHLQTFLLLTRRRFGYKMLVSAR